MMNFVCLLVILLLCSLCLKLVVLLEPMYSIRIILEQTVKICSSSAEIRNIRVGNVKNGKIPLLTKYHLKNTTRIPASFLFLEQRVPLYMNLTSTHF